MHNHLQYVPATCQNGGGGGNGHENRSHTKTQFNITLFHPLSNTSPVNKQLEFNFQFAVAKPRFGLGTHFPSFASYGLVPNLWFKNHHFDPKYECTYLKSKILKPMFIHTHAQMCTYMQRQIHQGTRGSRAPPQFLDILLSPPFLLLSPKAPDYLEFPNNLHKLHFNVQNNLISCLCMEIFVKKFTIIFHGQ